MACNCYSISASQDPLFPSLGVSFFYTTCDGEVTSIVLEPFESDYICSSAFPSAFPSDRGTIFEVDNSFCVGGCGCSPTTPATGTEISMGCVYGAFGLAPFPGANIGLNSTLGVNRQPPQALGVTAIASSAETELSVDMGGLNTLNDYCCVPSSWFVSSWNTANTTVGSSSSTQVKLPLQSDGTYNFIVEWGDGNSDTITVWNQAATTHTYVRSGIYTINIIGVCQRFAFHNTGDRAKLLRITSFGNVILGSYDSVAQGIFFGCTNLNLSTVKDVPNLSTTTKLINMFRDCTNLTTVNNINSWNVSNITNMQGMFASAINFNSNIAGWNVSNVTNMSQMFSAAADFNQPIGGWNVSNVTTMNFMFSTALAFNQDVGSWNVSSVLSMTAMFQGADVFNSNIGSWNVSNVVYMDSMFLGAEAFNQNIGSWNVSNVINMETMFGNSFAFNQPIGTWDVSNVTDMSGMFGGALVFNQSIGSWNVSNVTDMSTMFQSAFSFNQPIGDWNVSNVTNFTNFMLNKTNANYSTTNLNAIYNGWSTRPVTPNLSIDFGTIKYTAAGQAGRNILTGAPNNWTITDGGT